MPTPEPHGPSAGKSPGYETTDVSISGVLIFMLSLAAFVSVFFAVCFGIGRLINTAIVKHDGPPNRWNAQAGETPRHLEYLKSNAEAEQQELHRMTESFPTPRLAIDNGDQDVVDLHAREDLLLDHYTWVDRQKGEVRIPIERAMELTAQRGLPVAPATQVGPLMMGDKPIRVAVPLTDGFARTGPEQQALQTLEQQRMRGERPTDQASLATGR
jgi:hypothetical protein